MRSYGIDPSKPVELTRSPSVMHGFSPVDGEAIRPAGSNGTRVAAIELMFSPPKTVSALWATADPYRRAQIEAAHREAVKSALERTEREVALVRRKTDGVVRLREGQAAARRRVRAHHRAASRRPGHQRDTRPAAALPPRRVRRRAQGRQARRGRIQAAVTAPPARAAPGIARSWRRTCRSLGLPIERRTGQRRALLRDPRRPRGAGRALVLPQPKTSTAPRSLFRQRYGREPRRRRAGSLTLATRGSKCAADPDRRQRGVAGTRRGARPDRGSARRNSSTTGRLHNRAQRRSRQRAARRGHPRAAR